jgi:hypothetical protein
MTRNEQRISAAAAVTIAGGLTLILYLEWRWFLSLGLLLLAARVGWAFVKRHAGIRPRARRGRTVLELVAAMVAGWWLARKHSDVVAQAVRSGAELQIQVRPKSRYRA